MPSFRLVRAILIHHVLDVPGSVSLSRFFLASFLYNFMSFLVYKHGMKGVTFRQVQMEVVYFQFQIQTGGKSFYSLQLHFQPLTHFNSMQK